MNFLDQLYNFSKILKGIGKLENLIGLFKLLFEEIGREIMSDEVSFVILNELLVDFSNVVASN